MINFLCNLLKKVFILLLPITEENKKLWRQRTGCCINLLQNNVVIPCNSPNMELLNLNYDSELIQMSDQMELKKTDWSELLRKKITQPKKKWTSMILFISPPGAPRTAVYKFVRCNPVGDQANCVTHQGPEMAWNPDLPAKLPASAAQYLYVPMCCVYF